MITQDLINYINQQTQKGISADAIKELLLKSNWLENDIDQAFEAIRNNTSISTQQNSAGPDHQTKLIIVVVTLVFVFPVGIVLMWLWMKDWPNWAKIVLTLPVILSIIAIVGIFFVMILALNTRQKVNISNPQPLYNNTYRVTPPPANSIYPTDYITPAPSYITPAISQ